MGDAVEENLQIGIHHPRVAFFEELIHFLEGILGPPLGTKPIAVGQKLLFKDRLYYQFNRRLNDAILYHRDTQ